MSWTLPRMCDYYDMNWFLNNVITWRKVCSFHEQYDINVINLMSSTLCRGFTVRHCECLSWCVYGWGSIVWDFVREDLFLLPNADDAGLFNWGTVTELLPAADEISDEDATNYER